MGKISNTILHLTFPANQLEEQLYGAIIKSNSLEIRESHLITNFDNWKAQAIYFMTTTGILLNL